MGGLLRGNDKQVVLLVGTVTQSEHFLVRNSEQIQFDVSVELDNIFKLLWQKQDFLENDQKLHFFEHLTWTL